MALIGNYSSLQKSPATFMSGTICSDVRSNNNKAGQARNAFFNQTGFQQLNSVPNGYRPPYSWIIAQKDGNMAAYTNTKGSGVISPLIMAGGVNRTSSMTGSGSITNAPLQLLINMIASITASGRFSTPPILIAPIFAVASLTGHGQLNTPVLGAIVGAIANLLGQGNVTTANLLAKAYMVADITSSSELSPQNLAKAVMASIVESGMDMTEALRLLTAVAAGKTTIVSLGGGAATVTFRDVGDTKDRIIADMTGSERTTVTKDLA